MMQARYLCGRHSREAMVVGSRLFVDKRLENRIVSHETAADTMTGAVENDDCTIREDDAVLVGKWISRWILYFLLLYKRAISAQRHRLWPVG